MSYNETITKVKDIFKNISSEAIGWIAVMVIHASIIPNLFSMMRGWSNDLPPIDILLMLWTGLVLFFIKAVIKREMLIILTIGLGFVVHAVMLALIFIK